LDETHESGTTPPAEEANGNSSDGTTATTASAEEGQKVFEGNCLACHGREGTGGHNGPDLQLSQVTKDPNQVLERVKNGGKTMPAFGEILNEQQIKDVTAY
jgi:quinohemoprotein ethanol dehydrogenase